MTTIQLNVLFKKMQKDDKKEVLLFHVMSDELPHAAELLKMPGKIAVLTVGELEPIGAEFASLGRDNKKTVLKFNVKRDDENKVNQLYPFAGTNVDLLLQSSQMTIDEFNDENKGIAYDVAEDGTVSLSAFDYEVEPPPPAEADEENYDPVQFIPEDEEGNE